MKKKLKNLGNQNMKTRVVFLEFHNNCYHSQQINSHHNVNHSYFVGVKRGDTIFTLYR